MIFWRQNGIFFNFLIIKMTLKVTWYLFIFTLLKICQTAQCTFYLFFKIKVWVFMQNVDFFSLTNSIMRKLSPFFSFYSSICTSNWIIELKKTFNLIFYLLWFRSGKVHNLCFPSFFHFTSIESNSFIL